MEWWNPVKEIAQHLKNYKWRGLRNILLHPTFLSTVVKVDQNGTIHSKEFTSASGWSTLLNVIISLIAWSFREWHLFKVLDCERTLPTMSYMRLDGSSHSLIYLTGVSSPRYREGEGLVDWTRLEGERGSGWLSPPSRLGRAGLDAWPGCCLQLIVIQPGRKPLLCFQPAFDQVQITSR